MRHTSFVTDSDNRQADGDWATEISGDGGEFVVGDVLVGDDHGNPHDHGRVVEWEVVDVSQFGLTFTARRVGFVPAEANFADEDDECPDCGDVLDEDDNGVRCPNGCDA